MLRHTVPGLILLALLASVGVVGHSVTATGQSDDVTVASSGMMLRIENSCHSSG